MRPINKVTKTKERLLFVLDSIQELDDIKISSLIPAGAKRVEVTCKPNRQNKEQYILEIDYILSLDIKEITLKEEE